MVAGCLLSWKTIDLSPKAGYEWVMHGSTTLNAKDVQVAYEVSNQLYDSALNDDEKRGVDAELRKHLGLEQGVPTAVGSGRQGLAYKLHAWAHSCRLTSPSWKAVCEDLSSAFTIVGDLGEKSMIEFCMDIRLMFGEHVETSDMESAEEVKVQTFTIKFAAFG